MSKTTARLERIVFKTSRLLDFVGRRELTAQIGHEPELWPLVVLKELLDNALDACEEGEIAPEIAINVSTTSGAAWISLSDNGPGIVPETIADILDYSTRTSSREAYCSPTRGQQGNALKTIVAMPYALAGGYGETLIESRGVSHRISFSADPVRREPRIKHQTEANGAVGKNGTSVTVFWPDSACSYLTMRESRFLQIAAGYAVLNPHLRLVVEWDGDTPISLPASDKSWQKWRACDPTSAYWYDVDRLARYAAAHVARAEDRSQSRTVREFISEFRGLSGSAKQKLVLEETGFGRQPLAALFENEHIDYDGIGALLEAMRYHTRPVKARDLGVIGAEHMLQFSLAAHGVEETFRYRMIHGETEDGIPFVVEAAFAADPESEQDRRLVLGINWAAALANPFRTFSEYDGLETRLAEQRCGHNEPVVIILHLACARIVYQDRGKSAVVLDAEIADAIGRALDSVTGAWAKQRKAEERDHSRRMRRAEQIVQKPKRVTTKEAASEVMREAYMKASDGGTLPTKPRQIMYAARPDILALTGKDTLDDAYFTQTLLPDFIQEHTEECASWDIVWDARGNFSEPHTGKDVPLGTLEVRQYLNGAAVNYVPAPASISMSSRYPTEGPRNCFDTVLFIEKEGFGPLFKSVRLAERFDLAIMSTKGMSVTAARLLLDRLSKRDLKRILVLHDFDVSGFSIFGTLGTSGRRYRFTNDVPVIDLGLRLAHVEEMDLQSEPVMVAGDWEKRAVTLKQHGATAEEIKFLRNKRVEINAMTSRQLVDFIEAQMAAHGVAKVIPDDAVLDRHARHLIEQRLAHDAFERLRTDFADQAKTMTLPADLRDQLTAELTRWPQNSWDISLSTLIAVLLHGEPPSPPAGSGDDDA